MKPVNKYEVVKTEELLALYPRMLPRDFDVITKELNKPGCVFTAEDIELTTHRLIRVVKALNRLLSEKIKTGDYFGLKTFSVTLKKTEEEVELPILLPYEKGDDIKVWRVHKGMLSTIIGIQFLDENGNPEETKFIRFPNIMLR